MAKRKIKVIKPKRRKLKPKATEKKRNRRKVEDEIVLNRRKVKKKSEYPYHFLQDRIEETKKFTATTLVIVAKDEFGLDLSIENGWSWLRTKVCYQWMRRVQGKAMHQKAIDNEARLDTPERKAELKAEDKWYDPSFGGSSDGKGGNGKGGKSKRTNVRQLIIDLARGDKSTKEIAKAVTEVLVNEKDLGKEEAKKKALSKVKRVRKNANV